MLLFFIITVLVTQISSQFKPRISAGELATRGQFPYFVSIERNGVYNCGGSIISETFILTAAHCIFNCVPSELKVKVSTIELQGNDGQRVNVKEVIVHPQYNPQTKDFDISLIRLGTSLQLGSANVNKIELSSADRDLPDNTVGLIAGFKAFDSNMQAISQYLLYAYVPLLNRDNCNPENIAGITERIVCAGHSSGETSTCHSDGGSPLTVNNKFYGIASFGTGCGAADKPVLYTYVAAFRNWIQQYVDL